MTEPGGFQYKDDSIVARISVDVPAQAITDIDQVRERASLLRTELEAIARASGDWNAYLQQIPAITEQANQSYRNMITQLERMSYIQQELGGHSNVGVSGAPMGGQGGGPAPYSTAAPSGYVDPFMGMPGTGVGMGMQGAQTYMQSMMMNDPRMFANMAAQRGIPINPAQLGLVGGAAAGYSGAVPHTGGGMGQGAATPGSMSPQPTQSRRDSAAPPDPNNSGQASTSEPVNMPTEPHPDSPSWQKTLASTAGQIYNETRQRGPATAVASALKSIGSRGGGGGGGDGSDGTGGEPSAGGWKGVAKGAGIAGAGIGLGIKANQWMQNAGEQVQQYQNLGAVRGGGFEEGLGYEMNARIMAMNPFLTLDQSRQVYQAALKNGYNGKQFDNVVDFMSDNLQKMNMSVNESAQLLTTNVDKGKMSVVELGQSLDQLKKSSTTGEQSFGEKRQQYEANSATLAGAGLQGDALDKAAQNITEGFANDRQLKNVGGDAARSLLSNDNFLLMMGQDNGAGGQMPAAVIPTIADNGGDPATAMFKTITKLVKSYAEPASGGNRRRGAAMLQTLLGQFGANVDMATAQAFYDKVVGGGDFGREGAERTAQANADRRLNPSLIQGAIGNITNTVEDVTKPISRVGSLLGNIWSGDGAAAEEDVKALPGEAFRALPGMGGTARQRAEAKLQAAQEEGGATGGGSQTVNGTVNGELRVTVDQQGKVSAPQSVQISGSQRGVNSGMGSGTMNNPSPGDPAYQHAMPAFGGGK